MKLAITVELDVDMVAWGDEYGVRGPADVKADVQQYVSSQISGSHAGYEKLIRSVTVTKVVEKKS